MDLRTLLKPRVWLPATVGILIGTVLLIMGENDDAPGLVLIGFIAAIVLVFYGIYNAAAGVKKGLIPAILCFFLFAFGVFGTIALAIEGEFADSPGIIIFIGLICMGLLMVGIRLLKNNRFR
ncbi:hypothetical protein EDD76_1225 [Kineothrix alysoides]|uniref:Uncharacterized protein n=1 Tax=Kineothrix alysoides TaxID=1469948 RepID=A0A4R1QKA8_9FIRM|nr:hypothetical protein [Kineothrix alysoides]TCL54089.1 hypothetical protein EDD76_1225 [Kineothrix alysoides]